MASGACSPAVNPTWLPHRIQCLSIIFSIRLVRIRKKIFRRVSSRAIGRSFPKSPFVYPGLGIGWMIAVHQCSGILHSCKQRLNKSVIQCRISLGAFLTNAACSSVSPGALNPSMYRNAWSSSSMVISCSIVRKVSSGI